MAKNKVTKPKGLRDYNELNIPEKSCKFCEFTKTLHYCGVWDEVCQANGDYIIYEWQVCDEWTPDRDARMFQKKYPVLAEFILQGDLPSIENSLQDYFNIQLREE